MRRNPTTFVFGVLLLALGLVALIGRSDPSWPTLSEILSTWWPLALVAAGVSAWLSAPKSYLAPVVLVGLGVFFQLSNLDLLSVSLWELAVPVAIVAVGLALLIGSGRSGPAPDRAGGPGQTVLRTSVLLSGANLRPVTADFQGGSLSAVLGGIEVDLRGAQLVGTARLDAFALLGGIDLKVPPTWRVAIEGTPLLGGWEDKTNQVLDPNAPTLLIRATAILGGIDVKN